MYLFRNTRQVKINDADMYLQFTQFVGVLCTYLLLVMRCFWIWENIVDMTIHHNEFVKKTYPKFHSTFSEKSQ